MQTPAIIIRIPLSSEIGEVCFSPRFSTKLLSMQDVLRWLSDRPARQLQECLMLANVASQFHDVLKSREQDYYGKSYKKIILGLRPLRFQARLSLSESCLDLYYQNLKIMNVNTTTKLNLHPFHYVEL